MSGNKSESDISNRKEAAGMTHTRIYPFFYDRLIIRPFSYKTSQSSINQMSHFNLPKNKIFVLQACLCGQDSNRNATSPLNTIVCFQHQDHSFIECKQDLINDWSLFTFLCMQKHLCATKYKPIYDYRLVFNVVRFNNVAAKIGMVIGNY